MLGSVVLEVGIGLVITFLLFSLILTSLQEGIESLLKGRAQDLEKAIGELIDSKPGDELMQRIYEHPLIYPLFKGRYLDARNWGSWPGFDLPSYIPKGHFSAVLTDLVNTGEIEPTQRVRDIFRLVDDGSDGAAGRAMDGIEHWYDAAMQRLSGKYKRKTQMWLFVIGLAVAAAINVNPIRIAKELTINQQLRENLVALAPTVQAQSDRAVAEIAKNGTAPEPKGAVLPDTTPRQLLNSTGLPIGYDRPDDSPRHIMLIGWIITALAGMLGAPFWFDMLSKLMNVRASMKPAAATGGSAVLAGGVEQGPKRLWAANPATAAEGCCAEQSDATEATADMDLPPAQGGVAAA